MSRNTNAAPVANPIRKYFAPYFRARWQNYQNIISNADFFAKMPPQWITYQNAYVRQWDEWTRGFVLQLHRGDFFSVGMGKTVCDILVKECMKGRFRFDGKNEGANGFMTAWGKAFKFDEVVSKGFLNANRLGNNILRLNVADHEVYPTSHGVDRVYFEVNKREEISRAVFYDYLSADTADKKSSYYTVEDRVLLDDVPYYRVSLYECSGQVTNPTFSRVGRSVETFDLFTQAKFRDLYGKIEQGRWYRLPFKTLGCYNWKNKEASTAINAMPGLSESSVHTALDILYSIDYNWSMGQLDMYWGRTRIAVPREMQARPVPIMRQGLAHDEVLTAYEEAPLKNDVYLQLPSCDTLDGKPTQPIVMQPDMRGEAHKLIRDADLELLASKCGLSSSTLANHLTYNASKTATEIDSEDDTTDVSVGDKRRLAEQPINALIRDVLDFYGIDAVVDITWNSDGKSRKSRESVLEEYNAQLMPRLEAIKKLHPELTQTEAEQWDRLLSAQDAVSDIFDTKKSFLDV